MKRSQKPLFDNPEAEPITRAQSLLTFLFLLWLALALILLSGCDTFRVTGAVTIPMGDAGEATISADDQRNVNFDVRLKQRGGYAK